MHILLISYHKSIFLLHEEKDLIVRFRCCALGVTTIYSTLYLKYIHILNGFNCNSHNTTTNCAIISHILTLYIIHNIYNTYLYNRE